MFLCKNWVNCGNKVAKAGSLCKQCQEDARELDRELDREAEREYLEQSSGRAHGQA